MTTQVHVWVAATSANLGPGFDTLGRVLRPGGFIVIGLYNTYGRLLLDLRRLLSGSVATG